MVILDKELSLAINTDKAGIGKRFYATGSNAYEIAELTALVGRWNKQWPGLGSPGSSQVNGSSSTNGSKLDDKLIGIGHGLINGTIFFYAAHSLLQWRHLPIRHEQHSGAVSHQSLSEGVLLKMGSISECIISSHLLL